MTTDAVHVPAANEVIYGGFNDMCVQHDFLNSNLGAINANKGNKIAWDERPAQLFYFYHNNQDYHQASTFGLASSGKRIDGSTKLAEYDCAIHTGNAVGTGNTYIGDMAGWVWAAWTRPVMGALSLQGKTTFVATPPLASDKLSADGTQCTMTFKACHRMYITSTSDRNLESIDVQVWREASSSYEVIKTFKLSEILAFDPKTDTAEEVLYDYGRNTLSCDMILHPGDNVEIVSKVNGHVILDDILVVTK
jgi:hypothetical protein